MDGDQIVVDVPAPLLMAELGLQALADDCSR